MHHSSTILADEPTGDVEGVGDVEEAIMAYLRDLRRANLARATIVRRRSCLFTLRQWIAPRSFAECTSDDISLMLDTRRVSPRTRYHWISHLHCFFEWGVTHGHLPRDPTATIIRPHLPKLLPRPILDADLQMALLCSQPTMRCWLVVAALGGLRCAEIAGLDAADVLVPQGLIRVYGKGSKERMVPLHVDVVDAMRVAAVPKRGPLWDVTPGHVSAQIAAHLRGLDIDATAHQLRHWYGTKVYMDSKDLRLVQELMGHASPVTTAGYAAFDQSSAAAVVARIALPT